MNELMPLNRMTALVKRMRSLIIRDNKSKTSVAFILEMHALIKINNELINKLAIEIHDLNNDVLEQRTQIKKILGLLKAHIFTQKPNKEIAP